MNSQKDKGVRMPGALSDGVNLNYELHCDTVAGKKV
jgi:hypothetical protein